MSCRFALALCLTLGATVRFASSCNAAGMQKCNQDYFDALTKGSDGRSCEAIDNMLSCLNTACEGCQDAVKQQFNAIVSPIKSGGSCKAGATCANSTICTASEPLTCSSGGSSSGSATSGAARMSCSFVLFLCIALGGLVDFASSCNAAGMQKCNQDYFDAILKGSDDKSCAAIDNMLSCLNTACEGCQDAVKQQFNAIVSPIKSGGSCKAGATCASSTICTASEPLTCSSSGSSPAGSPTSGGKAVSVCILALAAALIALMS